MKKIISLVLVLCLIFALAPAAFADTPAPGASPGGGKTGEKEKAPTWDELKKENGEAFLEKYAKYFFEGGDGILEKDGHLVSCDGKNCICVAVLKGAEEEYRHQQWLQSLQVWYRSGRDADDQRHDTVVAELERPYKPSKVTENKEYLEGKEAVAEKLNEFANKDLADMLYRPSEFIHNQTIGSLDYAAKEFGSQLHVEYMLMSDGVNPLYGHGIGLVEDGSDKGAAEHFALSREPISDEELPEHDLYVRAGNLVIALPESWVDKAFSLGLSYYANGAVRVMLCDDSGKLIPGAVISTVLADGASKAAVVNDSGKLEVLKNAAVEGKSIAFEAPTGDDVFALTK